MKPLYEDLSLINGTSFSVEIEVDQNVDLNSYDWIKAEAKPYVSIDGRPLFTLKLNDGIEIINSNTLKLTIEPELTQRFSTGLQFMTIIAGSSDNSTVDALVMIKFRILGSVTRLPVPSFV